VLSLAPGSVAVTAQLTYDPVTQAAQLGALLAADPLLVFSSAFRTLYGITGASAFQVLEPVHGQVAYAHLTAINETVHLYSVVCNPGPT
jgi:hypothetical protein